MSNRGDNLSNSEVIAANGEAEDGDGDAGGAVEVLDNRLWKEPYFMRRVETRFVGLSLRHVKARRVIIESSLFEERKARDFWYRWCVMRLCALGPTAPFRLLQLEHRKPHFCRYTFRLPHHIMSTILRTLRNVWSIGLKVCTIRDPSILSMPY
jgi:hypothetical protein